MTVLAMSTLDFFLEMMHFMLPAVVVFLVTYFILKKMLDDNFRRQELEIKAARSTEMTPIKLQAYERFTLLLERIRLDNIVMRLAEPTHNATEFKSILTQSIDKEFNHNISQQIYVSDQAWQMIKLSKEESLQVIETSFQTMNKDSMATDLGKSILTALSKSKNNVAVSAISFLKKEIDLVF
ncbi:MAG: hypothetical protein ACI9JN_002088 [Bacteroidia bacterium]|jgi:hypothetical protein